ncbi:MAG: DUF4157 domain-containing protein [Bacteroidota bacterium]
MQSVSHDHSTPSKAQTQPKAFVSPTPVIQRKLAIGSADDVYEAEADAMADKVVGMSDSYILAKQHSGPLVQRKCAACEEEMVQKKSLASEITPMVQRKSNSSEAGVVSQALTQQINSSQGNGHSLDKGTQSFMESRFGTDFSGVRIHTDTQAIQMSRDLNAQAFTVGNDIYFNEGKYNPNSNSGKHLLAHELTHTLQQKTNKGIQPRRLNRANREHPKVVLYQMDDRETPEHSRLHPTDRHRDASSYFRSLANSKANQIGAMKLENSGECTNTGANGYLSAQHIFETLAAISRCANGLPIRELHIYSHGFREGRGVVGSHTRRTGLLASSITISSLARQEGARSVTEFPAQLFAHNATIVLHGCQTARGDSSISEELYRHLTANIPFSNIAVYGHIQSGNLGNENRRDWVEFSQGNPDGQRTRERSPYLRRIRRLRISQRQLWDTNVFMRRMRRERTYDNLRYLINNWGLSLWYSATSEDTNTDYNDIGIFEFRNHALNSINSFTPSRFTVSNEQRRSLIRIFDDASRGLTQINYLSDSTYKRILISGFDPYGTPSSSNPSGMVALALDNEVLSGANGERGQIQSVIFPVSYSYFDEGRIESFFSSYLSGENAVNMIMTISQNGASPNTEVEVYAGRNRTSLAPDNEGNQGGGTPTEPAAPRNLTHGVQNQFLRSTLPSSILQSGYRDDRRSQDTSGNAIQGSGGGYLSNEIFYRVAALRMSRGNTMPTGHLHIPRLTTNTAENRTRLINLVRGLIRDSLSEI